MKVEKSYRLTLSIFHHPKIPSFLSSNISCQNSTVFIANRKYAVRLFHNEIFHF